MHNIKLLRENIKDFKKKLSNRNFDFIEKEFEDSIGAWRAWSDVEDGIHLAFYEFGDLESAHKLLNSDLMKEFIKEFDKHWLGKVTRTRDVFEVRQTLKK